MDGYELVWDSTKKKNEKKQEKKTQLHSNAWNQKSHKETWLAPEVPIPEARCSHCLAMQAKI